MAQFDEAEDLDLFDADVNEPLERKPRLTLGKYQVTITSAHYQDGFSGKYWIIEGTREDDGSEFAHMFKLDVKSKKAKPYVEKRIRAFMNPALGRKNIPNDEVIKLIKGDGKAFVGAKLNVEVKEQRDDEGELKTAEDGTPYLEQLWSAVK